MILKSCPFCGGQAKLVANSVRSGYAEYERNETYHVVVCGNCECRGKSYHQKHLINFTVHTVSDFRNNPVLRAQVEDDYEAYCQQTKKLAVDAWNRRIGEQE